MKLWHPFPDSYLAAVHSKFSFLHFWISTGVFSWSFSLLWQPFHTCVWACSWDDHFSGTSMQGAWTQNLMRCTSCEMEKPGLCLHHRNMVYIYIVRQFQSLRALPGYQCVRWDSETHGGGMQCSYICSSKLQARVLINAWKLGIYIYIYRTCICNCTRQIYHDMWFRLPDNGTALGISYLNLGRPG